MFRDLPLFDATPSQAQVNNEHPYPVVSLFSGAMGLDLGLEQAGLHTVVAQDIDAWCVQTLRRNGQVALGGDLRELLSEDPSASFLRRSACLGNQEVFAVVGGPPCQPFSTAGKRLGTQDHRGQLYEQFLLTVSAIKPRFIVFENVKGLSSMSAGEEDGQQLALLDVLLRKFKLIGYTCVHGILDAVHYGTPQFRERLVILGSRDGEELFLPEPTHFPKHQDPNFRWRTAGEALDGILEAGRCSKFSAGIERFLRMVPEGGNWKSLPKEVQAEAMGGAFESGGGKVGFFRRLSRLEPAPTLVTSPTQKATLLAHPLELRPLSVREYARLQGFPDSWIFEGSLADCYRQIGNAVPVPLGRAIGQVLLATADGRARVKTKRMRGTAVHQRFKTTNHEVSFD